MALKLLETAKIFNNTRITELANNGITAFARNFPVSKWKEYYTESVHSREQLNLLIGRIFEAHEYCITNNMPQRETVIDIAGRMPVQLFRTHQKNFDVVFQNSVMTSILNRLQPHPHVVKGPDPPVSQHDAQRRKRLRVLSDFDEELKVELLRKGKKDEENQALETVPYKFEEDKHFWRLPQAIQ